jgi:hypothetical protein
MPIASAALPISSLRIASVADQLEAMYDLYIMRRTQIYLTDEQGRLLERRSKATGTTVSELIRAAIDDVYVRRRTMSRSERVRLARKTAGAWKDVPGDRRGVRRARPRVATAGAAAWCRLMRLVLDTSVLIDHLRGRPAAATALIPKCARAR